MRSGLSWRVPILGMGMALALQAAVRPAPADPAPARTGAATVYEREGARDTTDLARRLRSEPAPEARAAAARALGRIQERASAPVLVEALRRDPHPSVRAEAAFALGLIGDTTAAAPLALRLDRERAPRVRERILTALGYLGARAGSRAISKALSAPRAEERWAAALAAGRSRDPALAGPLTAHAGEAGPEMRWRVAYALGRVGERSGAPALRALARDPVEIVRYHAARSLGDVGDSNAVALLETLLADRSWRVRANAAHALGALGGGPPGVAAAGAGRALAARLGDGSAHVRWEAALALGALGDSSAANALERALSDSATGVVQGAAMSLLRLRGERAVLDVAPALDLLPPFLRSGLVESLGPVAGPIALETLLARARDSTDAPQAAGAASALGRRRADAPQVAPVLRGLLAARDYTVACSAAEALGQLGDSASVPDLAALLRRHGGPEEADLRASASAALAALKTKEALAALGAARRDPERRIRETACAALGLPPDSVGSWPGAALRLDPRPGGAKHEAAVRTERGAIAIALDAAAAPRTVANFIRLARTGAFNGLAFHRVVPNFVVQTGCPRGDGWGGPGYAIPCEYTDRPYRVGTVGMALSGKDTGGSQWFITLSPQPRLEGRYTVFGQVTRGMDVVERLMPGDRILGVTVR